MVGGTRRDEALVINSTNVFAALGTLRKKKKGADKEQGSSSKDKAKKAEKNADKKEVFWAPAPLTAKSWADVDDEDDDDYYATTAPLSSAWADQKESEPAVEVCSLFRFMEDAEFCLFLEFCLCCPCATV